MEQFEVAIGAPEKIEARITAANGPGPFGNAPQHSEAQNAPAQVVKDFATVRAEAAMHGITVCRVADDSGALNYLVGKWAWSRSCKTLDEVRTLVDRMGGTR